MISLKFWKTKPQKARRLKKALRYLDPHHALWDAKELESFYVDRAPEFRDEIIRLLKRDPNYPKFLLSGPPGCGKSTELGKIKSLLERKFHVILFSARDMTNNYKVDTDRLLATMLFKIADLAKEKRPALHKETLQKLVDRQKGWETKYAEVDPDQAQLDPRVGQQIEQGQQSYKGQFRLVTRLEQKPTQNEIIGAINNAAEEFLKRRFIFFKGKRILLLISDLDKIELESAREIFITSSLAVTKLNVCSILTFPLTLKYENEFVRMYRNFNHIYFLESFPVYQAGGKIDLTVLESLKEIISKRISEKLIEPDVLQRILFLSGGIPFELINIVRECCKVALRLRYGFIDIENLQEAISRIRATYQIGLTEKDRKILRNVHIYKRKIENADLTRLLNQYWITEYGAWDNVWYDINPILINLIKETELFEE